ncbi:MAG TPA: helix-turn-helix domain-containing protein [Reyranella sp.]|nr:helix-turn-helix domain-containing protein [Reyranella sp.]
MAKRVFEGIMAGLQDALADSRGERGRVTRAHRIAKVNVKAIRAKTGMSQAEFARTFRIPMPTLSKWEQGQRSPTGPARLLLHMIDREPKSVLKVVRAVGSRG